MREIVGFVMGAAAGAAGALFATSTEGRALLERLKDEARPEIDRAATEWEPVLREVSRAVRLAVRELETASGDLRARIGEIAAALPDDEVALAVPDARSRGGRGPGACRGSPSSRPRPATKRPPAGDSRRRGRRRAGLGNVAATTGRPTMRRFFAQVVVNALTILIVLFFFSLINVDYTDPFTGLRFTRAGPCARGEPAAHAPVHGALRRARGGVRPAASSWC